jgi:hypothetical protein
MKTTFKTMLKAALGHGRMSIGQCDVRPFGNAGEEF